MPPRTAGNKGCGVWMTSSSLPHLINNQISHNNIYGVAVFCRKDDAGDYPASHGGSENFQEEREGAGGENDPNSEEEHLAARRRISVALVELNSINHNGGELRGLGVFLGSRRRGGVPNSVLSWPTSAGICLSCH